MAGKGSKQCVECNGRAVSQRQQTNTVRDGQLKVLHIFGESLGIFVDIIWKKCRMVGHFVEIRAVLD